MIPDVIKKTRNISGQNRIISGKTASTKNLIGKITGFNVNCFRKKIS